MNSITIVLLHNHYDQEHLEEVKKEMLKRGAPKIRAIWNEAQGVWMAVEGCHRLRAAKDLGLTPIIKDVTNNKYITIQVDEENKKVNVSEFAEELTDMCYKLTILDF